MCLLAGSYDPLTTWTPKQTQCQTDPGLAGNPPQRGLVGAGQGDRKRAEVATLEGNAAYEGA